MKRFFAGVIFFLLAMVLFICACAPDRSLSGKNIIVIVVDTLRRDRLGIHGCDQGLTPGLDALAREGFYFHRATAPASLTQPSVASLFTGLYPGRHGALGVRNMPTANSFLRQDHVTLAERLREQGYRTAAFITNPNLSASCQFDQGFDHFVQPAGIAEELLKKAAAWIDSASGEGRFFCYLHLIDPHMPYFPPEEFRALHAIRPGPGPRSPYSAYGDPTAMQCWSHQYNRWRARNPEAPFVFDYELLSKTARHQLGLGEDFTGESIRSQLNLEFSGYHDPALIAIKDFLISLYDGEVAYTDRALDRFIHDLKADQVLDDSILVVTGDHGEEFLEHGHWGHGNYTFKELAAIPLIFRVPGASGPIQGNHDDRVSLVDLFPTLLDMVGLARPDDLDGVSLWRIMQNSPETVLKPRPIYCEALSETWDQVAVQMGDSRKLIRTQKDQEEVEWQYFDLAEDPEEQNPLELTDKNPEAKILFQAIRGLIERRDLRDASEEKMKALSDEEIKMMQELGYL